MTLEGKLKLRNFEKTEVQIVIQNPIPGKPLAADQGGTISVDPAKLRLLEREGDDPLAGEAGPRRGDHAYLSVRALCAVELNQLHLDLDLDCPRPKT